MGVLSKLEPAGVWKFFEDLCGIPHGSGNEKAVSDYCAAFAGERGFRFWQDKAWNVVIRKEASPGYEDREPLILQGHLDMVCEKKPDCDIDFEKDGLRLRISGDDVYAEGTTLGGDDGIAVAYALAILDDDRILHPALEAVFTTSEEVGMDGATALDASVLKGHTMLNLDSEEEGVLLTGCAGGCSAGIHLPLLREKRSGQRAVLTVGGLKGGHSGTEIDKGRGNASRLLALVLTELQKEAACKVVSIAGGLKDNAIPRECRAELLFPNYDPEKAEKLCAACQERFRQEYGGSDPEITVSVRVQGEAQTEVFTEETCAHALTLLTELPNGIIRMSEDIPGLVQTSLNLGVVKTGEDALILRYSLRSSVGAEKEALVEQLSRMSGREGASMKTSGDYPAWEYRKCSPLREDCVRIYEDLFGTKPKVEAIHAGLECGILASKIADLDCVSMGPEIRDIHTTEERLSISSVQRTWKYILEILKR